MQGRPNWSQVRQYQQHGNSRQPARQQTQTRQERKTNDHGGFDSLLVDRRCRIKDGTGGIIEGIVTAASKFWYLVNADGQIIVINKAWVVSITPVQSPNENNQQNTPVGEVTRNANK
jgi:hypothetical protein